MFNIDSVISQDVPFWVTYQIITIVSLTVLTVKILENIIVDENLYFWYDCARNLYKVIAFQKPQTILKDMKKKLFIKLQLYFGHITLSRPPILNLVHSKCPTQVSHSKCPTRVFSSIIDIKLWGMIRDDTGIQLIMITWLYDVISHVI